MRTFWYWFFFIEGSNQTTYPSWQSTALACIPALCDPLPTPPPPPPPISGFQDTIIAYLYF
jgi:hypothetical protein